MMSRFRGALTTWRGWLITRRINATRAAAARELRRNTALWQTLTAYLEKSTSTGVGYNDYLALYTHVRTHRPKEILECGTGVSTVVLAHALMENERETGIHGRVTSMEDKAEWLKVAEELLPEALAPYVDLVLSPRVEDGWYIFRGVRYERLPDRAYEFVFVDGPDFHALSDEQLTFNFDLIRVVQRSDIPVYALVDDRLSSSFVYQKVFGPEKARYSTRHRLCFIGPVTRRDLLGMESLKPCFIHSFRYFGATVLDFRMQPRREVRPE